MRPVVPLSNCPRGTDTRRAARSGLARRIIHPPQACLGSQVLLQRDPLVPSGVPVINDNYFDRWITQHQMAWRTANVTSREWGHRGGRQYPWLLAQGFWEEGLWPRIRTGSDNALRAYTESAGVQRHAGVHNIKISCVLCANLYFPFRGSADGKALFASLLKHRVAGG